MKKVINQIKNNIKKHKSRLLIMLYFLGLLLYLVAMFLGFSSENVNDFMFVFAATISGFHVISEGINDTIKSTIKRKQFTPNIHILMLLAAIGAIAIGDFEEATLLILIFAGAHFLEEYAESKSKREITKLLKMNPTEARLIINENETKIVPVKQLKVGDKIQVLNGDQIPTDGEIVSGSAAIDESSISGESIPKEKTAGDQVFGSTINGNSNFIMEVTKDSSETVFAKILKLVSQSQKNITKTATKIKKIEPIYVNVVLVLWPLITLLGPSIFGWSWEISVYRGMVFLISASPCALAASAIPATLSGISNLARRGVLFKGGSFLSNLNELKALAFDKTGTLTEGKPKVTDNYFELPASEQAELIRIIVSMEDQSNHPLATSISKHFRVKGKNLDLAVENEIGKGLRSDYLGSSFMIGKPTIFNNVSKEISKRQLELAESGKTVVYVAKNEQVVGLIALMDVANESAKSAIEYFKSQDVHTIMITGDNEITANAVAKSIGINQAIANVMPEDKSSIISEQKAARGMVGMVGDGVNDTPALAVADIGIAMGDGTDVAIDVADVVLMKNDLSKLVYAHKVSKRMNKVVFQNIFFSMFVVLTLVTLNFIGSIDITIGVIAHEGSTLVVVLNGLRLLYDTK